MIIASVVAELVKSVTPEEADSTAAIIVSLIIFASLLPLFKGLFHTWCELRSVTREEQELAHEERNGIDGEIS